MSRADFDSWMVQLTSSVAGKALDAALARELNQRFGPDTSTFHALTQVCREGLTEGYLCTRQAGGIRYGRVLKATPATHEFSVDVVDMHDVAGPHHVHPNGEIDLVMPLEGAARFDGHPAGWVVYGPGSAHRPTVSGGRALVLYLLPGGAIEFSKSESNSQKEVRHG